MRLKDKVAVVTGGSSGIGLAAARRLGAEGARIVIASQNKERIEAAADRVRKEDAVGVVRSGRMKFDRYATSDVEVRVFGASAIVTGRLQRTRTIEGRTVDDDWWFTKSYVRTQGKWLVVAFHASAKCTSSDTVIVVS